MTGATDLWTLGVIGGLACMSVLTRCFFFILEKDWALPEWAHRALNYAPVAALAGVVAPEVVMVNGQLVATWQDARLFGALAGAVVFFWGRSVFYTLLAGMAVYLPLRLGLGW